ncbi:MULTISPECIES: phage holin family protein [unclassified Comamonas]|jgi:uncharacterized membrane protein YqjE|uniref:phage holin family protein n=1 Tax=Comamonas TaxID=283 RepID=UPI0028A07B7C|nr:phage holin family protein [Comamonas sp.]
MNWLSVLGVDDMLLRFRALLSESAMAAEDRMDLLAIEWQEQKKNLIWLVLMGLVVAGLTIVALTVLSGAIIISFWDTPNRMLATWLVAGVWLVLWLGVLAFLYFTTKKAANPFQLTKTVLRQDWQAVKGRLK